jgi:uncharacterized protein YbjQ (UPF0145 family)
MEWLAPILNIALPVLLLLTGYVVGRLLERRHLASIRTRERELQSVVALNTRYVPEGVAAVQATVVMGSVVVSSDYFKTFVAGFRNLFGGRFRGYESLLERARREALLRMKLRARQAGSSLVIGVRFHTTSISGSQTPSVEVMAYGTAVKTLR